MAAPGPNADSFQSHVDISSFAQGVNAVGDEAHRERFDDISSTSCSSDDISSSDSEAEQLSAGRKCCRKVVEMLQLIASTLVLVGVTLGYCYWGGMIFSDIELPGELAACNTSRAAYRKVAEETLIDLELLGQKNMDEDMKTIKLKDLLNDFKARYEETGWDGSECEEMEPAWTYFGGFVWATTVVTTIGYGHIYPVTEKGQLIFIPWSLLGVALMLATLAKVGSILALGFKNFYQYICCCKCCKCFAQNVDEPPPATLWKTDSVGKPIAFGGTVIVDDSDGDDGGTHFEDQAFTVPLTVSIIMIVIVLLVGGIYFKAMEGWDMIDSIYFTYVSLTTIGFGDMVPGVARLKEPGVKLWLAGGCIFIFIGLAWLSMCFQLMQDEAAAKVDIMMVKLGCRKAKTGEAEVHSESESSSSDDDDKKKRRKAKARKVIPDGDAAADALSESASESDGSSSESDTTSDSDSSSDSDDYEDDSDEIESHKPKPL